MFEDIKLKEQHESVYKEIIEDNQYRVDKGDLRDKNVLDIGANNGVFTLLAKAYGAKKVVAVESNPEVFNLLESNIKGTDILAINKAALSKSGERVLVGRTEAYSNIDGRCYVINDKDGNIETISLADLLKNFDNDDIVLKMDCEGSEYDILMHSQIEDVKRFSTILIEMHENLGRVEDELYSIEEIRNYLKGLGYTEIWVCDYVEGVKLARYDLKLPKVTVIISEFLRPELLVRQIESFQNQTLKTESIIVWQTQIEGQGDAYKFENKWPNVYVIETDHDFNLPARFAMPLVARTPYVCLCDDDIFPGPKWLEECYKISKKYNAVVSPYGIKYKSESYNDLCSEQFGDNGQHSPESIACDMGGHAWFSKIENFSLFFTEPVINEKIADDIHFAYILKKNNIPIMVSPYPENNKEIWGNTDPDAGMGIKSLHTRKWEDEKIWKDINRKGWENSELEYLKNNLNVFCGERNEVVKKYRELEKLWSQYTGSKIIVPRQEPSARPNIDVTCVISTKDRYFSTLPHTIIAICLQTYKPRYLYIYDDSKNKKDLRGDFIYNQIFSLVSFHGITWEVIFTPEEGQVANHIRSIAKSSTDVIWRIDDDEIPEPDVLEKLVRNIKPDVGVVGGLIIPGNDIKPLPSIASNKIEDIYTNLNEQWFIHPYSPQVKEVDHLYSSFIYRKSVAEYCPDLSRVGHREETILTHDIKRKGYKVLLDPTARTWHWRNPEGGIRSNSDRDDFSHDERIFQKKMSSWGVTPNEYSYVVLENGLGDHFAFKSVIKEYLNKHSSEKMIFFTTFPNVFQDNQIQQASIADAKISFGNIDKYSIYKWMIDKNWKQSIVKAYAKMYNFDLPVDNKKEQAEKGDTIVISPYSFVPTNAKSYPYWHELIPKIKSLGYKLAQIGMRGEIPLEGMDEYLWNLSFKELEDKVRTCRCWISVDNFFQHMINSMDIRVKGIVIWGISDPDIFGYDYNTNILKDRKYLRPDPFGTWKEIKEDEKTKVKKDIYKPQNKDAFEKPPEVFKIIGRVIGSKQKD